MALLGFEYCSDEVAVVGPDGRLRPFPRIIALKPGGWRRITRSFPDSASDAGWPTASTESARYLQPPMCPDTYHTSAGYPIDFIQIPCLGPNGATGLRPIPSSRAMKELVEQSLDLKLSGSPGLNLTTDMVRGAECYPLACNDLATAATLVEILTR